MGDARRYVKLGEAPPTEDAQKQPPPAPPPPGTAGAHMQAHGHAGEGGGQSRGGTRAFLPLSFVERNALSFSKFVIRCSLNTVGMKEQILASANVNKPKTFVSKSLYSAFGHYVS